MTTEGKLMVEFSIADEFGNPGPPRIRYWLFEIRNHQVGILSVPIEKAPFIQEVWCFIKVKGTELVV